MLLYMPRRQKASTIFSFRRNGRHSTVENGLTQKDTDFIGLLKILSYAKPVIPRPVRRLVVGIRPLLAGFLFRSDGCFSFVGTVPPAAHFSQQQFLVCLRRHTFCQQRQKVCRSAAGGGCSKAVLRKSPGFHAVQTAGNRLTRRWIFLSLWKERHPPEA